MLQNGSSRNHPNGSFGVNESGIYKWCHMVKGDIEFEGMVISVGTGYPKERWATQLTTLLL